MTNDWQQQTQMLVEQGRQAVGGMISGEMVIDADPSDGFFRAKLLKIQPPEMLPQLVTSLCCVLANGGAMLNLQVRHHVRERKKDG